jgi:hypothetical protein
VREVEERELAGPMVVRGGGGGFFFQLHAETLAHFGGGGLGEGDDEKFVEGGAVAFKAIEAARDEGLGFAGAGAGHDEDIATRENRLVLRRRERIRGWGGRFHVRREISSEGRD